ncbi:hypothetical protein [Methylomonas albis]|uniref:Uncharacterized protein n=1 Tax=Methylomonas albis TaxID=1854563 RepID=A0ABR9D0D1_9GAMM|nr:hypothetical protein [Methylomonas albis]MBD9356581.1 hypothetical protein [Methylomonas albis]
MPLEKYPSLKTIIILLLIDLKSDIYLAALSITLDKSLNMQVRPKQLVEIQQGRNMPCCWASTTPTVD